MMNLKNIIQSGICLLLLGGITSCEENKQEYDQGARIYFPSTKITYSFGLSPLSLTEYVYNIPVRVMGLSTTTDRTFRVSIDTENTTANLGVNCSTPEQTYTVKAGEFEGVIPVTLYRSSLNNTDQVKLGLVLEESSDFRSGIVEQLHMTLTFDNLLSKPKWWSSSLSSYLGIFHAKKYQKFIEFNDGIALANTYDGFKDNGKYYTNLEIFKRVKEYFEAHPDSDVSFPTDVTWPI